MFKKTVWDDLSFVTWCIILLEVASEDGYTYETLSQKLITKHQWLVHSLYGQKYWDTPFFRREKGTSKLWQQRWKHNSCTWKLYFHICCNSFEVYEMTVPICTHMSLVFGDEFLAQSLYLESHQKCSAAFCRPVKFFHTDWIIISLWFLSYTQRHCHVRIEKGPVQTVAIKL